MTDQTTTHTRDVEGRETPIAGTWLIDPAHTNTEFIARHLLVTKVRGGFHDLSGTLTVAEDPLESQLDVTIQAGSIYSGTEDRDNHLKSPDFLDVDNFKTLHFRSTDITPTDDGWRVTGDLTIRDKTRPVTMDVEFHGVMMDPWGNGKASFSAATEIDREDWDLTWNVALEGGGLLVSKKVKIEIDTQASLAQ